jgi:hypothetical protein
VAELTMTVADYRGPSRWRWELSGQDGLVLADQEVQLDDGSWQHEAFSDLYGYVRAHVAPDRRLQQEADIVSEVGAWAGKKVLGRLGDALAEASRSGPVTVRVIVPQEPPAARQVAYLPLELAHVAGKPLALQGVTLVMQAEARPRPQSPAGAGGRLRVLALFSTPGGQRPLSLRRERVALVRLFDVLALGRGRAADLRVLQYGVTRDRLREVLQDPDGWDMVHISGHGQPGELLLETAHGSEDPVNVGDLAGLLQLARGRLKLVTISACSSAALTTEEQLRLLGVTVPGAQGGPLPGDAPEPAGGAVASELAARLDCAVLGMRYPVVDEFAARLTEKLYRLIAEDGQPVPSALGLALPGLVEQAPALSVATPTIFGSTAPGLVLAAPRATAPVSGAPGQGALARFPPPPERLAGRVALMARGSAALAPGSGASGVLLHGMPGGGKTACALELAHTHAEAFDTFAWYRAPDAGRDAAPAITGLALALEAALPGLKLAHLLDNPGELAAFWPVLTQLCQCRRVLFVIDNAESLVTEEGEWRDPRFGEAVTALSRHSGLSRLLLTSRVRPANLAVQMSSEQVDALPPAEALLLARELPGLASLMDGTTAGITAAQARTLARRALECAHGHPKLLELADGAAARPAALRQLINEISAAWRGQGVTPGEYLTVGEPTAVAGSYVEVLTGWTDAAAALLPAAARDMFWFLCCLEQDDRTSVVAEATWPQVHKRVRHTEPQARASALAADLAGPALITARFAPGSSVTGYGVHPAVAAAGRASAGPAFQSAVDTELGSYWTAASLAAAQTETSQGTGAQVVAAGFHAAPYLTRTGRCDDAVALLEDSLARDHSRAAIAAAIPPLRELAAALRGQRNAPAAVGTLARALAMIDPGSAERELLSVLEDATARADYITGFVAADDLCGLMRESGHLASALAYAEDSRALAARGGLGPWTVIAAERSRLLVLLDQGHAEQVLTEARALAARAASLPREPEDNEIVKPWMTQESLLDTARAAALRLEQWDSALAYSSAAAELMRRRGASAADLARARFNDYGPLLGLGRNDEAYAVVEGCKSAAEEDNDIEMLGVVFGALAQVEDARGHRDVAAGSCRDALRYLYMTGNPADVAGGHARLGNYTGRGGVAHHGAAAQFLAAALLHELSGTGQADNAVQAAAAHLRAGQDQTIVPASVAELCTRIQQVPGCDLRGLLARIWADGPAVERAYQEIARRVRAIALQPRRPAAGAAQWDPFIAAMQAAADGNPAAAQAAEAFLTALSQAGRTELAGTLRAIMAGDRDDAMLTARLSRVDAAAAGRALDAVEGKIDVPRLLWPAVAIAGLLLDLVMACRGAPGAPARARQALTVLSARPEWSALVPVLERILAGERDAVLDGVTDPAHRAVTELVLGEIASPRR